MIVAPLWRCGMIACMDLQTKKYVISFRRSVGRSAPRRAFYELAKKHIVKGKRGSRNLSQRVDEIAYGIQ